MKSSWAPVLLALLGLSWVDSARGGIIIIGFPKSIQDGVDEALASADTADIVRVLPGVYNEHVVVDFTGSGQKILNIEGVGAGAHVISDGIEFTDSRLVTLFNFTVDSTHGDGDAAIRVNNCDGFAAVACGGVAGDDGGIDADDSFEVIISSCKFSGMNESVAGQSGYGVRIRGLTDHEVKKSTFANNEFRGVWIEADRARVSGCLIQQTGNASASEGLFLSGLQNAALKNKVRDNDNDGVVVSGVCTVRDNVIEDNGHVGLRVGIDGATTFTGGLVKANVVRDNGSVGIVVANDQDGAEIRDNNVRDNDSAGIQLISGQHTLFKNTVRETTNGALGGHGIFIATTSDGNNLEGNSVRDNAGQGIFVDGDDNYVTFNTAKGNDGIVNAPGTVNNRGRNNKTSGGTNSFP